MSARTVLLGNVADVQGGLQVSHRRRTLPIEVPYLRVANVFRGAFDFTEMKTMRVTADELERVRLRQDDILVVEGHGNPDEIGRTAVWNEQVDLCLHQNHLIRVRVDSERAYAPYVSAYLNSPIGRRHLVRSGKTTSGLNTINITNVRETPVLLPPLSEQKHLAAVLDKADAIRRKRKEAIALTEELLRSTFLDMFGDPVTNPKGWPIETVGNLLTLKSGNFLPAKEMDPSGSYAVYGGNGINGRHSSFMFEEPVLTIGRVGVYCGVVHRTEPKSWVTDNALYVSKCSQDLNFAYLEHALRLANLNQYSSQAAQPLISAGRLAPVCLLVPSKVAQERFARAVDVHASAATRLREAVIVSEVLFDGLVVQAFSGGLAC